MRTSLNKLTALIKLAGEIDGRTKFQKIVYILKNKDVNFSEKFRYHYYGPYSSELQLEIDELVEMNIVKEENKKAFKYSLNPEVEDIIEDEDLKSKENLVKFLVKKDFKELELVSTIFFLRNNGYQGNKIINEKLKILKPHLQNLNKTAFETCEKIETEF